MSRCNAIGRRRPYSCSSIFSLHIVRTLQPPFPFTLRAEQREMRHDMEEAAVAEGCWRLLDQSQARKASWLDLGDITTEDLMWMRMDPLLVKLLHHGPLTSPSSFTISAAGTWLSSSPAPRGRKPQRAP